MNQKSTKMNNGLPAQSGFIALMAVVIISVILIGVSFSRSNNIFSSRGNALDSEFKRISLGLAESCVHVALLKISEDYDYSPSSAGETVAIDSAASPATECTIKSVDYDTTHESSTHQKIATISTQAEYKGAWSNIIVTATIKDPAQATGFGNIKIETWAESANSN